MKTHNLKQGSPEWHDFRASHYNASDAPAMLNCHLNKTRNDLMREKKTGIAPEVDEFTQRLYKKGHDVEAMARSLIESETGEDLFPVVASLEVEGLSLGASLDGVDMMETFVFEHKLINDDLRMITDASQLHKHYRVQMEQQFLVSGVEKCLFVASDGTTDDRIRVWYESDPELRKEIIAGWKQFHIDLETYEPQELIVKPAADPISALPALIVEITGNADSNLPVYCDAARQFIQSINTDLQTDEDFANAENAVKLCKTAEKQLEDAKTSALSRTASIEETFRVIDDLKSELRTKRLTLEKLVKSEKDARKNEIISDAGKKLTAYIAEINMSIAPVYMPIFSGDFAGAMRGKSNLQNIRDAVDGELASAKIRATEIADGIRKNLAYLESNKQYQFLFNDLQVIAMKPQEDFQTLVDARIIKHQNDEKERLEAERERIRAEEERKAKAEADRLASIERGKIMAEEAEKRKIEADKIRAEEAEKRKAEMEAILKRQEADRLEEAERQAKINAEKKAEAERRAKIGAAERSASRSKMVTDLIDYFVGQGIPKTHSIKIANLLVREEVPYVCFNVVDAIAVLDNEPEETEIYII